MAEPRDTAKAGRLILGTRLRRTQPAAPDDSATDAARRRGLLRNVAVLSGGEVSARLLTMVATIVIAHLLGPADFGKVSLAQTIALYVAIVGDGGLTVWTQRQIILEPSKAADYIEDTLVAQSLLGLVATALTLVLAWVLPLPSGTASLVVAVAPFMLAQALSMAYALQGLERMGAAALTRLVTQAATAAVGIDAVAVTRDPLWAVVALWLGQFAGDLTALVFLAGVLRRPLRAPRLGRLPALLRAGAPLFVAMILYQYSTAASSVSLGMFRSAAEVGIFSAAVRPLTLAPVVMIAAFAAMLPEMVRRNTEGIAQLVTLLRRGAALAIRTTTVLAVLINAEAGVLIHVLYGQRYRAASSDLRVLVFLLPAYAFAGLVSQGITATSRYRDLMLTQGATAIFATVAMPIAASQWGARGVSWALLVTVVLLGLAHVVAGGPYLGYRWMAPVPVELAHAAIVFGSCALVTTLTDGNGYAVAATWAVIALLLEAVRGFPTLHDIRGTHVVGRHRS
jgi:PST family polysaccharide transporter